MALYEDILDRLSAGEKVEDIAAYLTKTINDANKAYTAAMEEAKRLEEEEKRKAEELVHEKRMAVARVMDAFEGIIVAWGLGEDLIEAIEGIDVGEVVQEIDKLREFAGVCEKMRRDPTGDRSASALDEFLDKYVR